MTNPIPPSIGRIVLVEGFGETKPAIVTRVHSNDCINATVFSDDEAPFIIGSVQYAEDHAAAGLSRSFHWMDYQLKVAAQASEVADASPVRDDTGYARHRAMEYAIEVWKSLPQKDREGTTVTTLADEFFTFVIQRGDAEAQAS